MAVLTVGAGQQYASLAAAVAATHDGDTVYVAAGTYYNDTATINTKISIVGVGGMAQFVANQPIANGKAILVTNTDVHIDHLEFSGATVADNNGAGIRYQGGTLTVTNSYFHDNQDGILAAGVTGGVINIDHSEFADNGISDGSAHNLYIGAISSFSFTNSYSHDAIVGHELKSRADTNVITGDRFDDGNGSASYSIDLPNGGAATIENDIIRQGPFSENSIIISYGEETSSPWANSSLQISGNTFINSLSSGSSLALRNTTAVVASITGNHFSGLSASQIASGPNVQSGNDSLSSAPVVDSSHAWEASPWNNLVSGGAGNDSVSGSAGNDLLVGGGGADRFIAGTGHDSIADFSGNEGDQIDLSAFSAFHSLADISAHSVQNGTDTVIDLGNGNSLDLMNQTMMTLNASDFIFAPAPPPSSGVTLVGTAGADTLTGGSGNDFLYGGAGNDTLTGNAGNDLLDGGTGADRMTGGTGNDTYRVDNTGDAVIENAGEGTDAVATTLVKYTLPANVENLNYMAADFVTPGSGSFNGTGNVLDNVITGGSGSDHLSGLAGNDTLIGGPGYDYMTGGTGADQFVFTPADLTSGPALGEIMDFKSSQFDRIDLSAIDANSVLAGDQSFTLLGKQSFTHVAGQLVYVATHSGITIYGDTNGDGVADFSIDVAGVKSIAAGDFVL